MMTKVQKVLYRDLLIFCVRICVAMRCMLIFINTKIGTLAVWEEDVLNCPRSRRDPCTVVPVFLRPHMGLGFMFTASSPAW